MSGQATLPTIDDFFLSERLLESRQVVKNVVQLSGRQPLIIQFSGGKDSMAMLGLVQEVTDNFYCSYMATGLEYKGTLQFVRSTCEKLGVRLLVSNPGLYKGNLFKRIETLKHFPRLGLTWCCRDLKLRPQKLMLRKMFGNNILYKLEGIRMYESTRRQIIYKDYAHFPIRPDAEHKGAFEVFPILSWSNSDVINYLGMKGLPTSSLYNEFGVSGCFLCPFYPASLYYEILQKEPNLNLYMRAIEVEKRMNIPAVGGNIFLGDIRDAVLAGAPCPEGEKQHGKVRLERSEESLFDRGVV